MCTYNIFENLCFRFLSFCLKLSSIKHCATKGTTHFKYLEKDPSVSEKGCNLGLGGASRTYMAVL